MNYHAAGLEKIEYQLSMQTMQFHELYIPFHCWQKSDMLNIENKSFKAVETEMNI